jgi:hypothetical protein
MGGLQAEGTVPRGSPIGPALLTYWRQVVSRFADRASMEAAGIEPATSGVGPSI